MRRRSPIRRRGSSCAISVTSAPGSASCAGAAPGAPRGLGRTRGRRAGHPGRRACLRGPHRGRAAPRLTVRSRCPMASEGRVRYRRSIVLWTLGRYPAGPGRRAPCDRVLSPADDKLWTARALNVRGLLYPALGRPRRGDADFVGRRAAVRGGRPGTSVDLPGLNRGVGRVRRRRPPRGALLPGRGRGPVPAAERARSGLSIDRCAVLLSAGLAADALAEADAAIQTIERSAAGPPRRRSCC